MTDTLPTVVGHAPEDVLHFWFEELDPKDHFDSSPELDARIAERFGTLVEALEAAGYPHVWENTARGALALIIALDQFPRNIHRGEVGAFLQDAVALDVTMRLVGRGLDAELTEAERHFAYMPLMHSEDADVQDKSLEMFAKLGEERALHARAHREVIKRFGRYPGRNAALGRESTAEERTFLEDGGYGQIVREMQAEIG